jgi:glutathionylspermidine synthase
VDHRRLAARHLRDRLREHRLMWRHMSQPRDGWLEKVTAQGLVYPQTPKDDGTTVNYWNESAWYEFSMDEVLKIEAATEELWGMCTQAVTRMATDLSDARLGLPEGTLAYARQSIERGDPSVYGRFDLRYDGDSIKMLEINGDTPTGLVETGVIQWNWREDVMGELDQFNSVHERLIERWEALMSQPNFPNSVHFLWNDIDTSGEEEMTVLYMMDCANQAAKKLGVNTYAQPISHVNWDYEAKGFYDALGQKIQAAYKLYAWELMLNDDFGRLLLDREEKKPVQWIEPAWKVLLSTKAVLPVLWEMFPDHPLLLPAYFDHEHDLLEYIKKPLHGREGDNIEIHSLGDDGDLITDDGGYGAEGFVFQEYMALPSLEGNRPVIGSWIIDGQAAGMIVRESDGPVTDYYSRVVPHAISDGLEPDAEQTQAWLAERVPVAEPSL